MIQPITLLVAAALRTDRYCTGVSGRICLPTFCSTADDLQTSNSKTFLMTPAGPFLLDRLVVIRTQCLRHFSRITRNRGFLLKHYLI